MGRARADNPKTKSDLVSVLIVGLPNSGKSSLFNDLTGAYSVVANYPLTTIEPETHRTEIRGRTYEFCDTPGLHGLYIQSEEELVVRNTLFRNKPDVIIQCIDAARLRQSLLLTLDLMDLDVPLIIVMNTLEESNGRGMAIDPAVLSSALGVEVLVHSTALNTGLERIRGALETAARPSWTPDYGKDIEDRVSAVLEMLPSDLPFPRKTALLALAEDGFLSDILPVDPDFSRRIREVKGGLRGNFSKMLNSRRKGIVDRMTVKSLSRHGTTDGRFAETFARLSRHPLYGLPILGLIIVVTYLLVVEVAGLFEGFLSGAIVDPVVAFIDGRVSDPLWSDFLIGPYGFLTLGLFNAFVTVLPILSVFFILMGFLEDIGYLPNLSVLTRRVLEKIGLSGKSVMSLVLGFGCKTMATLTTRGITSKKEKFIAVYLIAFALPCSAQLALDMNILGKAGVLAFVIAFGTLLVVEVGTGFLLNKIIRVKGEVKTDFIQELPPIRLPRLGAVLKKTYYRIIWFLKEATPIFLIASVTLFAFDKLGILGILQRFFEPVVVGWLGLPINIVEVLILAIARHEAAAGFLLKMVDAGMLSFVQIIVSVVITTMFVPCFANIVAMCRELGTAKGLISTLAINVSAFLLAGVLNWILLLFFPGGG